MARPDSLAQAALTQPVTRPVWFATLDFATGALRATTLPWNVTLVSSDPDLNGNTFQSLNAKVQDFGNVHNQEGGSETLNISISGQIFPDNDVLNIIGDEANWQGRIAKFWQGQRDDTGVFTGTIWLYHAGWMSSVNIGGNGDQQFITMSVDGYSTMFGRASMRTYMDQTRIDPSDLSPQLVSTPGSSGADHAGSGGYGSGGGGGGVGSGGNKLVHIN